MDVVSELLRVAAHDAVLPVLGRAPVEEQKGAVLRRFLPDALDAHVASAEPRFAELSTGTGCAGADYVALMRTSPGEAPATVRRRSSACS
jgi:hypothetical protein